MPDIEVYVLTGKDTFSGAEEFAHNLKSLKRATIVGEVTRGGAHPGRELILNDRFTVWTPRVRAINPITGTNWEGIGVQPDIEVLAEKALVTAQLKALEKLALKERQDPQSIYPWLLTSFKAKQPPVVLTEKQLKTYSGFFGPKAITYEGGDLFFQLTADRKVKLPPVEKDLFDVEDNLLRIRFKKENDKISGITIINANGTSEKLEKRE